MPRHDSQRITLLTEDRVTLVGDYTPPPAGTERRPMAILLHMYNSDRSAFAPLVGPLHETGFAVLAIDLRGHGESLQPAAMDLPGRVKRRDQALFADMYRDVAAAYLWLRDRPEVDPARFALVGASVGCSVALDYARRDISVDAVACLTPGTNYLGLDSVNALGDFGRRPLLLLASEAERSAADRLSLAAARATLKIYQDLPGMEPMDLHGTRMFGRVPGAEDDIADFLRDYVGPPSPAPMVCSTRGQVYYEPGSNYARRLARENLRWLSSPDEAEERGLRPPKNASRSRSGGDDRDSPAPFPEE